ncbi:MAG: hypothetical protein R6V19_15415 [Armatimonadota bacterium]
MNETQSDHKNHSQPIAEINQCLHGITSDLQMFIADTQSPGDDPLHDISAKLSRVADDLDDLTTNIRTPRAA